MPDPNLNSISPTQKLLQQYLIDAPANVVKGLLGLDPQKDESKPGYWANFVGQELGSGALDLLKAGLPLAAITKGKPVVHGTSALFDTFDPEKFDTRDLLGHYIHTTGPDAYDYASNYAEGFKRTVGSPKMIGISPDAKNVLDLYDNPNAADLAQAVASLPDSFQRNMLKDTWSKELKEGANPAARGSQFISSLQYYLNNPEAMKNLPFDAIAYQDAGRRAIALNPNTQLKTPWGLPLTNPPKDLEVIRSEFGNPDNPGAKLSEDRWMRTPLNVKNEPPPLLSDAPKVDVNVSKSILKPSQFNIGDKVTLQSPFTEALPKTYDVSDTFDSEHSLSPAVINLLLGDEYKYKLLSHIPVGGK